MKKCNKFLLAGLAAIVALPLFADDNLDKNWAEVQAADYLQIAIAELDINPLTSESLAINLPESEQAILIAQSEQEAATPKLAD
ncbi:hypothetical protein P2G88_14170 [Aliiglaciecola sp. CAU 1673]|uniref:hypothetical protein n=1 Tax=Aliiglaciecola sp. CAU 1673 TaxID=3032595 RepID=UPI0023D9E174|nr:hypothetical protein [Aliiglaciecola sp. CAU 1673]MDF2179397.1 hypothetical protein [Aliiglaciecola sp. CAU 1673]